MCGSPAVWTRLAVAVTLVLRVPAQDDHSTLAALVERADAVAVASAVHVDARDASILRVVFAAGDILHGDVPRTFTLSETRGAGCGRSLSGIAPGQRFLACLARRGDRLELCAGGARALPPARAAIVAHARALLAAGPGPGRLTVLAGALAAEDERVRHDAALALPMERGLEQAGAGPRAAVLVALRDAVARQERSVAGLVTTVVRLREVAAIDVLLPAYLAGCGSLERLFVDGLARLDGDAVAGAVADRLPALDGPLARARATSLLLALDAPAARAPLLQLARAAPERGTRLRACTGLLRLGVPASDLAAVADPEILALARQAAQPPAPRFRSIRTN